MKLLCALLLAFAVANASASAPLLQWDGTHRYLTTAAGQPVYLTGSYYWGAVTPLVGDTYSLSSYVAYATTYNYNCLRLWNIEQTGSGIPTVWPHPRSGPGNAGDGGLKWDLSSFDPTYDANLTNTIAALNTQGIYASVMLWNGFSGETMGRFATNLHNTANNINSHVSTTNDWYTLTDSTWTNLMAAYVRHVADLVNPFDNVIWEVGNEMPIRATNLVYQMAGLISSYESGKGKQHPILISPFSGAYASAGNTWITNAILSSNAAACYGLYYATNNQAAPTDNHPQIQDSDHVWAGNGTGAWACQVLTRGYGGCWNLDPYSEPGQGTVDPNLRNTLGVLNGFARKVDMANMTPSTSVSTSTYALTNPSLQYLIYTPNKTAFTINKPSRYWYWQWIDPSNGNTTQTGVYSGGSDNWTPPTQNTNDGFLFLGPYSYMGGLEFDGVDDYASTASIVPNTATNCTYTAWIMPHAYGNTGPRITEDGGTYFLVSSNNMALDFGSNFGDCFSAANSLQSVDRPYFVAATRANSGTNGTVNLYINGALSGTANQTLAGPFTATTNTFIGNSSGKNRCFNGWIREVRIYNRVLSAAEIADMYNSKVANHQNRANLVAYWPLTDGSDGASGASLNLRDLSGQAHPATGNRGSNGIGLTARAGGGLRVVER